MSSHKMCDLKEVEDELRKFLEFCKTQKLSRDEISIIARKCLEEHQTNNKRKLLLGLLITVIVLVFMARYELFAWHLSAIGRIALIKLLPFYDWQKLKDEECLISKWKPTDKTNLIDCNYCESTFSIPYIHSNYEDIETFLDGQSMVIFDSNKNASDVIIPSILNAYEDFVPCNLASNVLTSLKNLNMRTLFEKFMIFPHYFIHFQNCEFLAVKYLRNIFPRPAYIPDKLAPIQYHWILLSSNYNLEQYKQILLTDQIAFMHQLEGGNLLELSPTKDCLSLCSSKFVELMAGEVVAIPSGWDLKYKPMYSTDDKSKNFAIIFETH